MKTIWPAALKNKFWQITEIPDIENIKKITKKQLMLTESAFTYFTAYSLTGQMITHCWWRRLVVKGIFHVTLIINNMTHLRMCYPRQGLDPELSGP